MSRIISLGTANPEHRHSQEKILDFMLRLNNGDPATRTKLNAIYKKSDISARYSPLSDYSSADGEMEFYSTAADLEPFPGISKRMREFSKAALPLSVKAIEKCIVDAEFPKEKISHVISVTCTGLSAPGLDLEIVKALKLRNTVQRTSVNFMGCYAAIHALKLADYICRSNAEAVVLIICTELCTLHFQKLKEDDHLISNSLFGDGAAAMLVAGNNYTTEGRKSLLIKGFYSEVLQEAEKDMSWNISETGFLMTLNSHISGVIRDHVSAFFQRASSAYNVSQREIKHWALHPGGKRIIEAVSDRLGLSEEQQAPARFVLKNFGNMSSASIVFVLQELWDKHISWKEKEPVFGIAFGPGLTIESLMLCSDV